MASGWNVRHIYDGSIASGEEMKLQVVVEVVMVLEVVEMEGRVLEVEVRELDIVVEVEVEGDDSVAMATMDC